MAGGVPAGATMPIQFDGFVARHAGFAMVGTSGSTGLRVVAPMPSARSLPEWICGGAVTVETNITLVWPPTTSIMAGPAALERHVQQVDAGRELEQLAAQMLEAADAGRGILQLARLLLRQRDQLLHRLGPAARDEPTSTFGAVPMIADRRERLDRIVGQLVEPRIDRVRERDDEQRVAVLRRVGDELAADHAAGAAAVVDDDLLAEPRRSAASRSSARRCRCCRPAGTGRSAGSGVSGSPGPRPPYRTPAAAAASRRALAARHRARTLGTRRMFVSRAGICVTRP